MSTSIDDLLDYTSLLRKVFAPDVLAEVQVCRYLGEANDVPKTNRLWHRYNSWSDLRAAQPLADRLGVPMMEADQPPLAGPKERAAWARIRWFHENTSRWKGVLAEVREHRQFSEAEFAAFSKFLGLEDSALISELSKGKDRRSYKLVRPYIRALLEEAPWAEQIILHEDHHQALMMTMSDDYDPLQGADLLQADYRGMIRGVRLLTTADESPLEMPLRELYLVGRPDQVGLWHHQDTIMEKQALSFTHHYSAKLNSPRPKLMVIEVAS